MAKNKLPDQFTYTCNNQLGVFSWDGVVGRAIYLKNGNTVHSEITYLSTVDSAQDASGNIYKYYAFAEVLPESDGRTRKWLFETVPRFGESLCTIYCYFNRDNSTLTFYGGAVKQGAPPLSPPLGMKKLP